jgi:hypothetical protein
MKERRGICSVCGEERSVTAAGVVRFHRPLLGDHVREFRMCPGTSKPPASFAEDPIAAAEKRGYAKAIAAIRAEEEYQRREGRNSLASVYRRAVEILEATDA